MNAQAAQWLVVVLFFTCFFAFTAGEVYWLNRYRSIEVRRAFAFSLASNIICITVGFFVSLVIGFAILAIALEENAAIANPTTFIGAIFAIASPIALLTIAKYFLLKLFKFEAVDAPFKYAVLASLLFFAAVTVIPCSAAYLLFR